MASSKTKHFEWNIETTKLLISLLEENECLYNNLNPDYKNRDKRLSTMTNIAKLISETTGRVCLVADIRKKINSLRSQYLAEKLKITKCKSGSGGDYTPTVYWFPLLRFLDISAEADDSSSNLDIESSQAESDSVDIQQTREEETEHQQKTKKKMNKKIEPAADGDDLIREATATMRQMSQHITSNAPTNSDSHITAFCNFVNSELTSILHASNNNYVKKAKRKIQMCLFDIWDEIDAVNMHEERPSTQFTDYSENSTMSPNTKTSRSVVKAGNMHEKRPSMQFTNYSENSVMSKKKKTSRSVVNAGNMHEERPFMQFTNYSKNSSVMSHGSHGIKTSRSVVTGNASSLVIKRNDLLTYNSPQENVTAEVSTEEEDNICLSTQNKSNIDMVFYPEEVAYQEEDPCEEEVV